MSLAVSKGEFARLIKVSPGRVSQMIAEGKIDGDALEGEGRFARIRADVARRQIAARTDISQRFGNGLGTQLDLDDAPRSPAPRDEPRPSSDPVADAIKGERLRSLQMANERAAEERLASQGRYVRADQAQAGYARLAGTMLNVFEGGLADMAGAIAAQFQLPARDVLHRLRTEFRTVRAKAAEAARRDAEGLPALIEDEILDASEPALGEA